MTIAFLAIALISVTACGGDKAAEEEPAVEETTPPPPPPPPPAAKKRSAVKPAVKEETPEQFAAVEEDEVETVAEVEFIPHRFSYEDLETEDQPLHVSMKAFDVAPIYGNKCVGADAPDKCSHDAIEAYLKNNIEFPDEAKDFDDLVEYVSFIVQANGEVDKSNIQVLPLDPQCHTCAAEALELIRDMPKWTPAQKGGTPVPARVTVPIRFHSAD